MSILYYRIAADLNSAQRGSILLYTCIDLANQFELRETNNPIGPLTSDAITCKSFGCATTVFAATQDASHVRQDSIYVSYTSSEDHIPKVRA